MAAMLNGWQRIGIVASVLWAIGGGLWGTQNVVDPMKDEIHRCLVLHPANSDEIDCTQLYAPRLVETKYITLGIALVPIPFMWLLAYTVVWIGRWIRRGFEPSA